MKAFAVLLSVGLSAASVHGAAIPDISKCPTQVTRYDWFGKPLQATAECSGCTTVTFVTGAGSPSYCAQYKDWVVTVDAQTNKVMIPKASGFAPGSFDKVNPNVNMIEIGGRPKYGPCNFKTLPDGIFDKMPSADKISEIFLSSDEGLNLPNPAKVFGRPFPSLKRAILNFPPSKDFVGANGQFLNSNLAKMQTLQFGFGATTLSPDLLHNLPELRTAILTSDRITSIPKNLYAQNKKLTTILLQGSPNGNKMPVTTIPETLFAGLPNLNRVDFTRTQTTTLPVNLFAQNPRLNWLNLVENNLSALPGALLAKNAGVNLLYLFGNKLASIPAEFFAPLNAKDLTIYLTPMVQTKLTCKSPAANIPKGAKCF